MTREDILGEFPVFFDACVDAHLQTAKHYGYQADGRGMSYDSFRSDIIGEEAYPPVLVPQIMSKTCHGSFPLLPGIFSMISLRMTRLEIPRTPPPSSIIISQRPSSRPGSKSYRAPRASVGALEPEPQAPRLGPHVPPGQAYHSPTSASGHSLRL